MEVRAKFRVDSIDRKLMQVPKADNEGRTKWENGEVRTVVMSPVSGGSDPNHENTKFWHASPSGKIELGCANLEAAEAFELGKEYYIDFILAE